MKKEHTIIDELIDLLHVIFEDIDQPTKFNFTYYSHFKQYNDEPRFRLSYDNDFIGDINPNRHAFSELYDFNSNSSKYKNELNDIKKQCIRAMQIFLESKVNKEYHFINIVDGRKFTSYTLDNSEYFTEEELKDYIQLSNTEYEQAQLLDRIYMRKKIDIDDKADKINKY